MKKSTCCKALVAAVAAIVFIGTAHADTKNMRIAFSNNYAGNSWRQAMLKSYDLVTKQAVADKVVAAADVFTTADKEVPTQAAQIQNLILQGYDAIVINGATEVAPKALLRQLKEGGRLVAVVGRPPATTAMLYLAAGPEVSGRPIFDARAPLLPGFAEAPAFVF